MREDEKLHEKLYKCLKKEASVKFVICYKITKLPFLTNTRR